MEMGGACGIDMAEKKYVQFYGGETWGKETSRKI